MGVTNLFLLLAEYVSSYQWMLPDESCRDELLCNEYLDCLIGHIKEIEIENYNGYYDADNLDNFLLYYEYEIVYPFPRVILSEILKERWYNWREDSMQSPTKNYKIFSQPIKAHTFCEISERKLLDNVNNYALLNHHACTIRDAIISIAIDARDTVEFRNLRDNAALTQWFADNRLPQRIFNLTPKHGENGLGNWPGASPLMCSKFEAQGLLNTAIGQSHRELFNHDGLYKMFIVFKDENTVENTYHGFHVASDTAEVPLSIKKRLEHKLFQML
ncbi:MAG: hypothetical protein HQL01_09835 [Nitrospirae bacterium]|nr:hypothetical protein [Nitrospirota bacterium]